jgi:hypothetical protein
MTTKQEQAEKKVGASAGSATPKKLVPYGGYYTN